VDRNEGESVSLFIGLHQFPMQPFKLLKMVRIIIRISFGKGRTLPRVERGYTSKPPWPVTLPMRSYLDENIGN